MRKLNRKPWTWVALLAAGGLLHFAVDHWTQALAIMAGAILIDIAVDVALFRAEKDAGEL